MTLINVEIAKSPALALAELTPIPDVIDRARGGDRVAFAELPQRWQIVLWRTAVDKDSNIEVGRAMGLSPNGVAALAKRAR